MDWRLAATLVSAAIAAGAVVLNVGSWRQQVEEMQARLEREVQRGMRDAEAAERRDDLRIQRLVDLAIQHEGRISRLEGKNERE